MNGAYRQIEQQAAEFRKQFESGAMTPDVYASTLGQLRTTDAKGVVWQISPETGRWIQWVDEKWVPADPYGDPFDDGAEQYRALLAQLQNGSLDQARFEAGVAEIRVVLPDGQQWAVQPDTGAWVVWDGNQWVPAEPPHMGSDGQPAVQETVFAEFQRAYGKAVEALNAGKIQRAEFDRRVAKFRVADEKGSWWQINPETGGWTFWNGAEWVPGVPPAQETSVVGPGRKFAKSVAESAKEELKATVRSIPRMIFTSLMYRAIMMVASYYGGTYLHAYFTGYKNDGYRDDRGPWAPWLFLTESQHGNSYAYIWGIGGMLLSSLILTILRRGPIKGVVGTITAPFMLFSRIGKMGRAGFGAVAIGAAAALLINKPMQVNPQANLSMAIGLLFLGAGKPGYYASRFLWGVIRRVSAPFTQSARQKLQAKSPIDLRVAQLALVGVSPGFYLASRLPADKLMVVGVILAVVGFVLVFNVKKPQPSAGVAATLLFYGFFGSVFYLLFEWLFAKTAFADDRGRDEFSGNPDDYWKTEGQGLVDHSKPAGTAAGAGAAAGGETTGEDDEPDPEGYRYALSIDPRSFTVSESTTEGVRAWVSVSGPDPSECADREAELNANITFSATGNVADWFEVTGTADSGGASASIYVNVPEDPEKKKGPNIAHIVATVNSPKGPLTARCRVNIEISSDYQLIVNPEELTIRANDQSGSIYAQVDVRDDSMDMDEQLAKTRELAPKIKFVSSGDQATWVGGPGEVEGYITGDGKEIVLQAVCPPSDLGTAPPYSVDIEVSCPVEKVGTLSKGARVDIEAPEWFLEVQIVKADLTIDFKDRAEFRARLVPMDSSKLSLYTGSDPDALNRFLDVRAEGSNAAYAVIEQKGEGGEFRTYSIGFSESAAGTQEVENVLDIVVEASITGQNLTQQVRINLSGKPSLEVQEKSLGLLSGGDPVSLHAHVKDGGKLNWSLSVEIADLADTQLDGEIEEVDNATFIAEIRPGTLPSGQLRPMRGTITLVAKAQNEATGEEILTEPVEVPATLADQGLIVSPPLVKLKLDPNDPQPAEMRAKVLAFNAETKQFQNILSAAQALEMLEWEDGDVDGGANVFTGAKVSVTYLRQEGSGLDAVAVYVVKPGVQIPAPSPIDAKRTLTAPGDWGDEADKFTKDAKFMAPADPAAMADDRIRIEQENCRKTLKYLPDGPLKDRYREDIETRAKILGADGLWKLRHEIWVNARDALMKEAESYLESAWYLEKVEQTLDWVNYLCGLIVQGIASVAVPFPGDFVIGLMYQAVPDAVNAMRDGKSGVDWVKEWVAGLWAGAGGMAFDMAAGQVIDLKELFFRGLKEFKDPRKAAGMACLIYWEVRFIRYQVTSKPNGEPYSLKESFTLGLKDLAEEIITTGISGWASGRDPADISKPKPPEGTDAGGRPPEGPTRTPEGEGGRPPEGPSRTPDGEGPTRTPDGEGPSRTPDGEGGRPPEGPSRTPDGEGPTRTPEGEGPSRTPDGEGGRRPEGPSRTPDGEGPTRTPEGEGPSRTPDGEGGRPPEGPSRTPDGEGPTRTPEGEGPSRTPDGEGGRPPEGPSRTPDGEGPTRTPEGEGPSRTPDGEGPSRTPDGEGGKPPEGPTRTPDGEGGRPPEGEVPPPPVVPGPGAGPTKTPDGEGPSRTPDGEGPTKTPDGEGSTPPKDGDQGHGHDPKDGRHYEPANQPPDLRGMPDANVRAAQEIAQKHNVEIYVRPTNPASKALLEQGALPKPEWIKMKTVSELDTKLGAKPGDVGKVGYFEPQMPPRGNMSDAEWGALQDRFKQRQQEFIDQKAKVTQMVLAKEISISPDGVVLGPNGKPFTGDHDVFDIRGPNGEPVSPETYNAVMKDLMKPPFNAQHPGHRQWDYSHLSKDPQPGGGQSPYEIAHGVDQKIINSHSTTTPDGKPGEPLIRVGPDGKIDAVHCNPSSPPPS